MLRRPTGLALVLSSAMLIVTSLPALAESAKDRIESRAPDRTQLERRFESVHTLLERSTAARQIDETGDAAARGKHAEARGLYQQAQRAMADGDLAAAGDLLSKASVAMFAAVRDATPKTLSADKAQTDYHSKRDSVLALLDAQKRIAAEKPGVAGTHESTRQVEALIAEADALLKSKKTDEARAVMERAYLIAKASISAMRNGDTLVRSLHFSTPEEEYRYELDRNDTHQMLIKVLLDEQKTQFNDMVRQFLQRAGTLRGQAEAAASRGAHKEAIHLLEDSTGELVKAIRNAGVYIPG